MALDHGDDNVGETSRTLFKVAVMGATALENSRCAVTGVAGFIGSHLAEALVNAGCTVIGIDRFSDYYPRELKERNLERLRNKARFSLLEVDLARDPLESLPQTDFIFHLAAQPGVRASWGTSFETYSRDNILATQRLLEAARGWPGLVRFIYASSSSIYGDAPSLPVRESSLPQPVSPYGVTKLAGEHLCVLYERSFGLPIVMLRYFTVYGPRQRPDMAFSRFIAALLAGSPIEIYGDGEQTRDCTYVGDIVAANLACASADPERTAGQAFNLGGGSRVSVNTLITLLQDIVGARAVVTYRSAQPGDARHTEADCSAARQALGFAPATRVEDGLRAQVDWLVQATRT